MSQDAGMARANRVEAGRLADDLVDEFRRVTLEDLRRRAVIGEGAPGPLVLDRTGPTTGAAYLCTVGLAPTDRPLLMVHVLAAPDDAVLALSGRARRLVALTRRYGLLWLRPVTRVVSL